MPTYVYECRTCQKSFEIEQRITESALTDCECGGTIRRIIQPVGISFKGSGFYVNDSTAKPPAKTDEKVAPKEDAKPAVPVDGSAPAPAPVAPAASETKAEPT